MTGPQGEQKTAPVQEQQIEDKEMQRPRLSRCFNFFHLLGEGWDKRTRGGGRRRGTWRRRERAERSSGVGPGSKQSIASQSRSALGWSDIPASRWFA